MTLTIPNIKIHGILENITALLFSLRAITYVWLAFASNMYLPFLAALVTVLRYITIPFGLYYILIKQRRANLIDVFTLVPLFVYWLLLVFNTYGGYRGSYLHELISIGCFLLMNRNMKIKVFRLFYKINVVLGLISVLVYMAYMIRLPIGFQKLPFYNDGVHSSFYRRWLIFAVMDSGYSLPRLCGIFNEPGGLGTVCALLFAATFPHSSKIDKTILIITTICSFSLAGYILIFAYLIIYLAQKNWKYALIVLGLTVLLIMIPNIDWHNDDLNDFSQRFSITTRGLLGDNRTKSDFDIEYQQIIHSDSVWFGKGATYTTDSGTSSYKNYIVQFGIIGFGLFCILWTLAALKKACRNKDCLILLFIFLISLYQRPVTLINTYGYVLLFGGFEWLLNEKEREQEESLHGVCLTAKQQL